ncbi:MAG: iron ABC transporter permease [Cellulomonadaceae bacterium]|nr:iron ABC transporter permease [Cellulomonadaceae bacterium]
MLLPLTFLAVFFFVPVFNLLSRGFGGESGADWGGLLTVLTRPRTWRLVRNTIGQALVGTAITTALGIPIAYLLYRTRFPGQAVVRALVMVPFVLPTVVVGVAFRSLLRPGGLLAPGGLLGGLNLDQSFAAVLLALIFFNLSVVVRTVGGLWQRLDPRQEQAARALGASPFRAFCTVTIPALLPAIAAGAALVALFSATAFGVVLVLGGTGYGTVETEIYQRVTVFLDLRGAAVLSILQLVVVAIALTVSQHARARSERAVAVARAENAAHRWQLSNRFDLVSALVTTVTVGLLIVAPLLSLVIRSLQDGTGAWTLANYRALNTATTGGLIVPVTTALAMSLRTAAIATALALPIGFLLALVLSRRPRSRSGRRAISGFDAFVMLPLGVSAVTVGFGFLITFTRPWFGLDLRTSGLLIPVAQAVVAIPLVVRTLLPVLRAVDPRQRQAAATLGASPLRVLRDVDLPLILRPLGTALGFAFAVSLGEFGATSFLARPDAPTLPVVIFRLLSRPGQANFGMALAAAVLLGLLTALVMAAVERLSGTSLFGG